MKNLAVTLSVIFIIIISSCQKYEEGPKISLKSKEKRLCNAWILQPASDVVTNYVFETDKDFFIITENDTTVVGTWEFSGDVDLILTSETVVKTDIEAYEILRLASDELKLFHKEDEFELEFEAK